MPPDVGRTRIRPTGTWPSNDRSPLSGRLGGVCDTPLQKPNGGCITDFGQSPFQTGVGAKNFSPLRKPNAGMPPDVGAYRIRPTGTRPSNNRSPLSGRLMGVCDTPLRTPNGGCIIDFGQSPFQTGVGAKNFTPLRKPNAGRPIPVGRTRIRPAGTRPSNNCSPLPGRLGGVFDTPLRKPNAGCITDFGQSAFRPFIWPERG